MKVEFISATQPAVEGVGSPEELIAYCARVSNPGNQMNTESAPRLLQYLIKHKHWSPFEMVNMCVSIETSRATAAQILRHRSFSFQEFSQRYAAVDGRDMNYPEMRIKADTNRQSSTEVAPAHLQLDLKKAVVAAFKVYDHMISVGVATESARMLLPLCTPTKLYMNGTVRSWIHYLEQRCDEHTQLEHREIAIGIKQILNDQFPTVHEAAFGA